MSNFYKRTNKIQGSDYATVENVLNLRYLTFQETALKFINIIGLFAKKIENPLFSKNVVIRQSSSTCPGSSSRSVRSPKKTHQMKIFSKFSLNRYLIIFQRNDWYLWNVWHLVFGICASFLSDCMEGKCRT